MAKLRYKLKDLILIDWLDACSDSSWVDKTEKLTLVKCQSIGWLHNYSKKSFEIYSERTKEGLIGLRLLIPRSNIEKVTVLKRNISF